ncbi:MAG: DUF4331 domain-containing protein [Pseudomonadota bacterium]
MNWKSLLFAAASVAAGAMAAPVWASSHMDAPSITLDDAANTTDVYAFITEDEDGQQYLTTALSVYPHQEPGIGPNIYRFDDDVLYSIHIAMGERDIARGRPSITYDFRFDTDFVNKQTIRQAFLGPIDAPAPGTFAANQNLRQTYSVTRTKRVIRNGRIRGEKTVLAEHVIVPPNNQGLVTPFYNQGNFGDNPAKEGVASEAALDVYTRSGIAEIDDGHRVFAGQRDDGFYADIQSIFDLDFSFGVSTGTPTKPFDSQGGYNVHTIVLNIPLEELDRADIAGVYATTARRPDFGLPQRRNPPRSEFYQVARQGNPLFNEGLVPLRFKDSYNQSSPREDERLREFAATPELVQLLNLTPLIPGLLEQIFIPDLIKVDLTTGPVPLAGEASFSSRSVFGGDVVQSEAQDPFGNGGFIPAGWPNGRRFGDDVVDIALIALGAAGAGPDFSGFAGDRVDENDITFNQVFPYAATPLNGRNHP